MKAIAISPITRFTITCCYGRVKFSLYQQQLGFISLGNHLMDENIFLSLVLPKLLHANIDQIIRSKIKLTTSLTMQ